MYNNADYLTQWLASHGGEL